jgi:lysophospholipase L1-like esterase
MIHPLRRLAGLVLSVALVAQLSGALTPEVRADPKIDTSSDIYNPVVVVLDTSGSMSENDKAGTPRIIGARRAVLGLVDALPPQSPFALIAYPGNGGRQVNGCSEGKVEIKLGPLDQPTASAAVRRLTPDGETPTVPALRHAASIIKTSATQKGTIVLVSDGESNCGSNDVCKVGKELSAQGIETRVNTVGFQISDSGAKELQCIANATGGRYAGVENEEQLQDALQDLSGARLTLNAAVPDPLPVVSGTGNEGPKAVLTVSNSGRRIAHDVRLSLDFKDKDGRPGAILVPRPIRFLGNLEPGQSRTIEIGLRPDAGNKGQFAWTATATATDAYPQRQEGKSTTAEPGLNGVLSHVKHLVVLGDSYSSGQGAGDYESGNDGSTGASGGNTCRRSANAYGKVLLPNPADATIIACGGAVTADFYSRQIAGNPVEPQLRRLRTVGVSPQSPDAVLLSIGGNDVDFVGTVAQCVLGAPGQTCTWDGEVEERKFRSDAAARIAGVADSLRRVYRDVNRAINDPTARARRGGAYAPIIVVPYPKIVPSAAAGAAAANRCHLGINANEVGFFNSFIDMLNLQIAAVVESVRAEHVPLYFASDVVEAFQPNHTVCDAPENYANFTTDVTKLLDPGMLHPNKDGTKAMARAISTWSAGTTMMSDPAEVQWSAIDAKKPVFDAALSMASMATSGGSTPATAQGYKPGSTVVFRMDSTPRILGSATASGNGMVDSRVPIPADIPPGTHHLHVLGYGPDGAMRDAVTTLWLAPPQTFGALIALVAGIFAVGIGLVGFRCARHRQ